MIRNPEDITRKTIMSAPIDEPSRVFSSAAASKDEYRILAKKWHPDVVGGDIDVFMKVKALYESAQSQLSTGTWNVPGEVILESKDGKKFVLRFKRKIDIGFGTMYYGPTILAFVISSAHASSFSSGVRMIESLKYLDDSMKERVGRCMPSIKRTMDLTDGSKVLIMDKTPDVFLLRDVLDANGGRIPDVHAAWMTSRLMELACYLEISKISHASINLDTVFVSPHHHSMLILGGWWCSTEFGKPLRIVPKSIHSLLPDAILKEKVGDKRIDRISIRALIREILGDRSGMELIRNGVPVPFANFLRFPPAKDAFSDLDSWKEAMKESFGPRKFVVFDVPPEKIYSRD